MISDKIKRLFQFIEFLHSNTDSFKKYDGVVHELNVLGTERSNLKPKDNFADKLKYDEIQKKIKEKFNVVDTNIITPFKNTAIELNVCDFQNAPLLNWNNIESDIYNLKRDFSSEDITEILDHKSKYIGFRTKTNCTYFNNFFFSDLDEILKELFDFFKEDKENEFEPFEAKSASILEGKKHELTNTPMQTKKVNASITDWLNSNLFFQVDIETENGKEKNNDSIITPANWESLKNEFFNQRMEKYNIDYNVQEKIDLELQYIDKLTFEKEEHQIIKERYKDYLNVKLSGNESVILIKDENLHSHIFKNNGFDVWQRMFDEFDIQEKNRTDLRFMYEVMKRNNQIYDTVSVKNITDWINDTYSFTIEKLQYTGVNDKANRNRLSIYNLIK